jgi:hypothetical protein
MVQERKNLSQFVSFAKSHIVQWASSSDDIGVSRPVGQKAVGVNELHPHKWPDKGRTGAGQQLRLATESTAFVARFTSYLPYCRLFCPCFAF